MTRSLRTRLMLLYAGPFFVVGAIVLGVAFAQQRESSPVGSQPPGPVLESTSSWAPLTYLGLGLLVLILVSFALGWVIAGRFLTPLRAIIGTARDISASNLHRRLGPTGRNDEFTVLAATLDDLFARLEAAFEAQRHFVANASHELRTPLTAERALLQVAIADPDATVDSLRVAAREVLALGAAQERLIDGLLTLASGEQALAAREPFDLAALATEVLSTRARPGVEVTADLGPAPATGEPRLVESLVANLVDNALKYNVVPGGRVGVTTTTVDGHARLTVTNTGPVVPPDQVARLFEPFQRLQGRVRPMDGHGLGLAIVAAVARTHGATVTATANPTGGLTLTATF